MGYLNGKNILPTELLAIIQQYVDGEYIYIPRKDENRKSWGEAKKSKQQMAERNFEIYQKYLSGISVLDLSREYYLSDKTIYSILAKFRKN